MRVKRSLVSPSRGRTTSEHEVVSEETAAAAKIIEGLFRNART